MPLVLPAVSPHNIRYNIGLAEARPAEMGSLRLLLLSRGYAVELYGVFKSRACFVRTSPTANEQGIAINAHGHTRKAALFTVGPR